MKIVVVPDSFKESLRSKEVCDSITRGIQRVFPSAHVVNLPLADGGEGTVEAMVAAAGGEIHELIVTGPLGEPVRAVYGLIDHGETAVMELAAIAGLSLIPLERRDPRFTTTRGVGEMLRHILTLGVRRIIVGIGGSGTNDGGAGMAQGLGYRLLDSEGNELQPGAAALASLASIKPENVPEELFRTEIIVASDVKNPLCGKEGASRVYGPQKGATPEMIEDLDLALAHFADVVERELGKSIRDLPGAGAAGGMGAGLVAFANGKLQSGFDLVAERCRLREQFRDADLIITGEGALDGQSVYGKAVSGVVRLAREFCVPVVALTGRLSPGYERLYSEGLTAAFALADGPLSFAESVSRTRELLMDRTEAIVRLWSAGKDSCV